MRTNVDVMNELKSMMAESDNGKHYRKIVDNILTWMVELVPYPNNPDGSLDSCEDGLRDLMEIRDRVNLYIRETKREIKRLSAGNSEVQS